MKRYYRMKTQTTSAAGRPLVEVDDLGYDRPLPNWRGTYVEEEDGRFRLFVDGVHVPTGAVLLEVAR